MTEYKQIPPTSGQTGWYECHVNTRSVVRCLYWCDLKRAWFASHDGPRSERVYGRVVPLYDYPLALGDKLRRLQAAERAAFEAGRKTTVHAGWMGTRYDFDTFEDYKAKQEELRERKDVGGEMNDGMAYCACQRVKYAPETIVYTGPGEPSDPTSPNVPIREGDLLKRDSWKCELCGSKFVRIGELRRLQERNDELLIEVERLKDDVAMLSTTIDAIQARKCQGGTKEPC